MYGICAYILVDYFYVECYPRYVNIPDSWYGNLSSSGMVIQRSIEVLGVWLNDPK